MLRPALTKRMSASKKDQCKLKNVNGLGDQLKAKVIKCGD